MGLLKPAQLHQSKSFTEEITHKLTKKLNPFSHQRNKRTFSSQLCLLIIYIPLATPQLKPNHPIVSVSHISILTELSASIPPTLQS